MPVGEFYTPEIWRQQSEDSKQASVGSISSQEEATEAYRQAIKVVKHYYEKLFTIGVGGNIQKYTKEQQLAEASKCIVICANHHKILHAEEAEKKYGKTY